MRVEPVPVATDRSFVAIDAGPGNTCALDQEERAWCWGANHGGPLGRQPASAEEAALPGLVDGGHRFSAISAGGTHTCALNAGGEVYCWGQNFHGEVGLPPIQQGGVYEPVLVPTDVRFASIDVRDGTSCGLTSEGSLYCWGLGWSETPSLVSDGGVFQQVSVSNYQVCALDTSGAAQCWEASHGQPTDLVAAAVPFTKIGGGADHFCAIGTDTEVYCWGYNDFGEVGDGTLGRLKPEPVRVVAW
jgi:alpha-tubulin suppressor-like RCC1 family protein